jgi:hypothetical protein
MGNKMVVASLIFHSLGGSSTLTTNTVAAEKRVNSKRIDNGVDPSQVVTPRVLWLHAIHAKNDTVVGAESELPHTVGNRTKKIPKSTAESAVCRDDTIEKKEYGRGVRCQV